MPESEVDEILKSIDEKDLEEDDCFFVFTLVLVERSKVKAQQKNKKRTWQQSRDLKEAMARDRSFFDRRRHQAPNKKPVRAGKKLGGTSFPGGTMVSSLLLCRVRV